MDRYEEIAQLKAELDYLEKNQIMIPHEKRELDELKQELSMKSEILKKENNDVDKLESTTIVSLFHKLIGNLDEKMEKEKYEAMQASLEYHRVLNNYTIKKATLDALERRYAKKDELEKRLQELQLEILEQVDPLQKEKVKQEKDDYEKAQKILKEVNEALSVGYQVKTNLEKIRQSLSKAEGWGIYDMLGGDFIATAIKHGHMDEAQRLLQETQYLMQRFEKEVEDVKSYRLSVEKVDTGLTVMDYVFDGIIFDWMVQSQIGKNLKNVEHTIEQVDSTINILENKKNEMLYLCKNIHTKIQDSLNQI